MGAQGRLDYSVVHPTSFVLFDVAKRMWEKVGLKPPATDYSYYYLHDLARSEIFPIYPPIAKIFGVQGGYLFKIQNHHLANNVGDFLTLPQYLEACFRAYEKSGAKGVVNSRVDVWLANEETKSQLIALARENSAERFDAHGVRGFPPHPTLASRGPPSPQGEKGDKKAGV